MTPTTMTDRRAPSVHLLGFDHGVGLSRTLRLLMDTPRALGYRVDFNNMRRRGGIPRLVQRAKWRLHTARLARRARRVLSPPYDFVLMEEHITPAYLDDPLCRVLVPHPEWVLPRDLKVLDRIDHRVGYLDDPRCDALGAAARAWYDDERTAFPTRLDAMLRGMDAPA